MVVVLKTGAGSFVGDSPAQEKKTGPGSEEGSRAKEAVVSPTGTRAYR
jgi:hypothetical protein